MAVPGQCDGATDVPRPLPPIKADSPKPRPTVNPPYSPPPELKAPRHLARILAQLASQSGLTPREFEREVTAMLSEMFPHSVLADVRLFNPASSTSDVNGCQLDNLIHIRHEGIDYLVEIEVKHQPLRLVPGGDWELDYTDHASSGKQQIEFHADTLQEYLRPFRTADALRMVTLVVSSDTRTRPGCYPGARNRQTYLCAIQALPELLAHRFEIGRSGSVQRIAQSRLLELLRLSLPVPELGHPELGGAIRFVERCRRTLDEMLFINFKPQSGRWAISGTAGMGKSVLLAYTAAVLCSGRQLVRQHKATSLARTDQLFRQIGFNSDPKNGGIVIVAQSAKQLDNLEFWFHFFRDRFYQAERGSWVRFKSPAFVLGREAEQLAEHLEHASALLVDEAHDLPEACSHLIAQWHSAPQRYLVVACDRHQRLELAAPQARIISGLDFSGKITRLSRIYRNPAAIYIASLALMFRWFGRSGPKVVPTPGQLAQQFHFKVLTRPGACTLQMMNDAHPANSWSHTVATFPDTATAFAVLTRERLRNREVLWVRFGAEDPHFDYENLTAHFTYHDCEHDAGQITDKYIKGQEFPIVVIEGWPAGMDQFETPAQEERAWAARRRVYLSASRATAFLYFVGPVAEPGLRSEIADLLAELAMPENLGCGGIKRWEIRAPQTDTPRNLSVFTDAEPDRLPEPSPTAET